MWPVDVFLKEYLNTFWKEEDSSWSWDTVKIRLYQLELVDIVDMEKERDSGSCTSIAHEKKDRMLGVLSNGKVIK